MNRWRFVAISVYILLWISLLIDGIAHLFFNRNITDFDFLWLLYVGFMGIISAILSLEKSK